MFLHSILSIFKWNTLYLHLILEKMNECRLSLVLGKREIIFADVVKTVKSDQSCLNTPSPPPQWIHDFFRIVFTGCLKKWNWFHEKNQTLRPIYKWSRYHTAYNFPWCIFLTILKFRTLWINFTMQWNKKDLLHNNVPSAILHS